MDFLLLLLFIHSFAHIYQIFWYWYRHSHMDAWTKDIELNFRKEVVYLSMFSIIKIERNVNQIWGDILIINKGKQKIIGRKMHRYVVSSFIWTNIKIDIMFQNDDIWKLLYRNSYLMFSFSYTLLHFNFCMKLWFDSNRKCLNHQTLYFFLFLDVFILLDVMIMPIPHNHRNDDRSLAKLNDSFVFVQLKILHCGSLFWLLQEWNGIFIITFKR